MKISIAARYRLFSHQAGASCLLPRTGLVVQAFPTLIRIGAIEVPLPVTGPVREFTLLQDLEKGCVFVFGCAQEGRFRIRITAGEGGIDWRVEKALPGMAGALWWNRAGVFQAEAPKERFSLGCHRAQDMDLAWRRLDLCELLPLVYRLSQWTPVYPKLDLQLCELELEKLLPGAFASILTPHWTDERHQGLLPVETALPDLPAAALVHFLGSKIRGLFFKERPFAFLAPSFTFGRFTGVQIPGIGECDLEWSKGVLRKVIVRAKQSGRLFFDLPHRHFRARTSLREKGFKGKDLLEVEADLIYYLDRFQK